MLVKVFEKLSFIFPVKIDYALIQFFKLKREQSDGEFRDRFFTTLGQYSGVNPEADLTLALPLVFL